MRLGGDIGLIVNCYGLLVKSLVKIGTYIGFPKCVKIQGYKENLSRE